MGIIDDLAAAHEPQVATTHHDGTRGWVPFWIVRVGEDIYARSFRGPTAAWYTAAIETGATTLRLGDQEIPVHVTAIGGTLRDEIDAAYQAKYAPSPAVPTMVADAATATTVRFTLAASA